MAEERANHWHPFWKYRYGVWPTPGRRYLNWRHTLCRNHVEGKRVLDVPCGEGLGLHFFKKANAIICLDYDAAAVEKCRGSAANIIDAICASMTSIPLPDGAVECVTSLEGLEHLDKRDGVQFLSEVYRVLAPNGVFLLSCPISTKGRHSNNEFHLHEWTWQELLAILEVGFTVK